MTSEEECLGCKWCNLNQLPRWYTLYHEFNPFTRLYIECYHPEIYWIRNGKKTQLNCVNARADAPDTETITRCGVEKKYFEPHKP